MSGRKGALNKKRLLCYIFLLCFLAGIHHGRIAIWQGEDPEPKWILPYSADFLPKSDLAALEKGIRIESSEELTRFLEDFCS